LPKRKQLVALEEFTEERRRFIRYADNLVRCLTIEFEIELGPRLAVIPVGEMFKLAPPQRPLRERSAFDGEAYTRCLPGNAALLRDRFGGSDNAARDEALPAFVLACEHENHVAFGDMLTAVHRLLRSERECLSERIANLGFDRESHASPLPARMSITVIPAARLRSIQHQGQQRSQGWVCPTSAPADAHAAIGVKLANAVAERRLSSEMEVNAMVSVGVTMNEEAPNRFLLYIGILGFSDMNQNDPREVARSYSILNKLNAHKDDDFKTIVFSDTGTARDAL
jgi:hypothetical protein